jgi:hypothetical protein
MKTIPTIPVARASVRYGSAVTGRLVTISMEDHYQMEWQQSRKVATRAWADQRTFLHSGMAAWSDP